MTDVNVDLIPLPTAIKVKGCGATVPAFGRTVGSFRTKGGCSQLPGVPALVVLPQADKPAE
jgi:hypothetical protein